MWTDRATKSYRVIGAGTLVALDQASEQPERHGFGATPHRNGCKETLHLITGPTQDGHPLRQAQSLIV